jgi:hypothetical protein
MCRRAVRLLERTSRRRQENGHVADAVSLAQRLNILQDRVRAADQEVGSASDVRGARWCGSAHSMSYRPRGSGHCARSSRFYSQFATRDTAVFSRTQCPPLWRCSAASSLLVSSVCCSHACWPIWTRSAAAGLCTRSYLWLADPFSVLRHCERCRGAGVSVSRQSQRRSRRLERRSFEAAVHQPRP